jgi:DNA modification methylase
MTRMKIGDIKPNPSNPRIIKDDKFAKLVQSIKDFPQMLELRPIVINSDNIVLGGNMRLRACKEAGLKEVPVMRADDLTPEQQAEFIIKDNVGFGEWDWEMLANEWEAEKLNEWGLDVPDFEATQLEAEEDDYEIPDEIKTDIVVGDLFEIGEHRLLCGDSTDSDAVAKLMNGEKAEMLFTSPPYSDMRKYNGEKNLSVDKISDFIPTWMPFSEYQVVNLGIQRKDNEIVQYWDEYIEKAKQCGYKLISWNVWDKTQGGSIASATAMFMMTHEWIFVFGNNPKNLNRTIPNQLDKYEAKHGKDWDKGLKDKSVRGTDDKMKTTTSQTYSHHQLHTVIQQTPELGHIRKDHPATFPVGLPTEYIKAMTNENQVVAESFTGSGTTMVASHQLKRKCYGMELDPKYCQVIVDRMLKLDPTLVVKRNGQPYVQTVNEQRTDA